MEKGYLYIATGKKYVDEALISAKSLKKVDRNAHITLVTDKKAEIAVFDNVIVLSNHDTSNNNGNNWKVGILFKVLGLQNSPYKRTFFVDTDTFFCDDCSELFQLLDFYDLLIADAPTDKSTITVNESKLEGYHPYNTGVIVFKRNKETESLLNSWLSIYKNKFDVYLHDQAPFMEALLFNPVKLYILKPIYNFRIPFFVSLPALKVKILHGRSPYLELIPSIVNTKMVHRGWHPGMKKVMYKKKKVKTMIVKKSPKILMDAYHYSKEFITKK